MNNKLLKKLVTDPDEIDHLYEKKYLSQEYLNEISNERQLIQKPKQNTQIDPDNENLRFIIEI